MRTGTSRAGSPTPGVHDGRGGTAARDDGRRADRQVREPEHLLHRRLAAAEGPAARRARRAGQHREPRRQLLGPPAFAGVSSPSTWTWSAALATTGVRWTFGSSSPTWPCSTSRRPITRCGCGRCIPGWTWPTCVKETGFELVVPDDVAVTPGAFGGRAGPHPPARPGRATGPGSAVIQHSADRAARHPLSHRAKRHGLRVRAEAGHGGVQRGRARHHRVSHHEPGRAADGDQGSTRQEPRVRSE